MMLIIICYLKLKKKKLNITNACWKYGWKITRNIKIDRADIQLKSLKW